PSGNLPPCGLWLWRVACLTRTRRCFPGSRHMKKVLVMLMFVPAALAAGGIQGGPSEQKPGMPMMNCPMSLQGTSVAVADTAAGIAVSITTKPENVTELQKRVEQMAAMHSGQASSAVMMQGQM